jgi:hypothetical protein
MPGARREARRKRRQPCNFARGKAGAFGQPCQSHSPRQQNMIEVASEAMRAAPNILMDGQVLRQRRLPLLREVREIGKPL